MSNLTINNTAIDNELLTSWVPYVKDAMYRVWKRFNQNTKCILTESDLKCWMFYELNQQIPDTDNYSVHTEITHYTKKKGKRKLNFRDLSLLDPTKLLDSSEVWATNEKSLKKGFLHRGEAIHFELKFIRQGIRQVEMVDIPTNDIENFSYYKPNTKPKRRFVVVWGSRNENVSTDRLIQTFEDASKQLNGSQKHLLQAFLFDRSKIVKCWFERGQLKQIIINKSPEGAQEHSPGQRPG